ncbi:MAG: pimeloyl-ACP methyl ester esterase BioH [Pseudomonadota bacterium]
MSLIKPYVAVSGTGPDLVMLHGWGLHSDIWDTIKPELEQRFRLHCIDLPGFGRSPLPNREYSLAMLAESVLAVAPAQAYWLGWSLGGLLTMHLAATAPHRLQKLITVASNPYFIQTADWPHAMKPEVMDNFASLLTEDYEGTIIRFLGIQTMGSITQKEDIVTLKRTAFLHGQPAPKALTGGLDMLRQSDLRQDIQQIEQPWLRLYGRLDGLVPVKAAEETSRLHPRSQHLIYPKASHAPFLSHKEDFVNDISAFLLDIDSPSHGNH